MNIGTPLQAVGTGASFTIAAVSMFVTGHPYWALALGMGAMGFFLVAARLYFQQLQSHEAPPTLDLVVRSAQRPYVQEVDRSDEDGERLMRWFRVGVLSDKQVNVHVLLDSCIPEGANVFPAHALRVLGQPVETEFVNVHPGTDPTVFIDVFTQAIDERSGIPPEDVDTLHLCYVRPLNSQIPNQRQRLRLKVEGGGASCCRYFVINFDAKGLATFTPD